MRQAGVPDKTLFDAVPLLMLAFAAGALLIAALGG
jgi:hypothetical protein